MADATVITLISLGVTVLFMLGVPVFLVIATWVVGCSAVLGLTLDNMGA
ncbi:MAG: TRAP transporter large permease, partial [Candidatus Puniceispirillaceae bacterium]